MSNQPIQPNRFLQHLLVLLFGMLTLGSYAQDDPPPTVRIGDPAPPLQLRQWLKGKPFKQFKKGKVHVVEFWATWCGPCKAAMPHLSALAREYRNKVNFLSVDVMEDKRVTPQQLQRFVDSMGKKMDYSVAAEDNDYMVSGWLKATGEVRKGIPHVFVVDAGGKLAWIGHPKDLAAVLPKIINKDWDLQQALASYNEEKRLTAMDQEISYDLLKYKKSKNWASSQDKPDSLLLAMDTYVRKEPKLKYAPVIVYSTFATYLKTDMRKAVDYGNEVLKTGFYGNDNAFFIMGTIDIFADSLQLSPEIYKLGIEACQVEIANIVYPEIAHDYKVYSRMANWFMRINEPDKAIIAQEKAIASLKSKTYYSSSQKEMAELEAQLKKYKDGDFGGLKESKGL